MQKYWWISFNHFRLVWRLWFDRQVSLWLKLFLVALPLGYALLPLPDDVLPLVGVLDDAILLGLGTLVFVALCPPSRVACHRRQIEHLDHPEQDSFDAYRYPSESRDLALGFLITSLLLLLFGYLAGSLLLLFFILGYVTTAMLRAQMLANALQVSHKQLPALNAIFNTALQHLPPVSANLFVTQNPHMNAFTFGYNEPYSVVLTSALVEGMEEQEIQAVIGHELGHVLFGHVRLINMMAGVGGIFRLIFFRWSRSCEYSADAIALLACGNHLHPAACALLRLSSGLKNQAVDVQAFLEQLQEPQKKSAFSAELFSSHPFIHNRIRRLVELSNNLQAEKPPASRPTAPQLTSQAREHPARQDPHAAELLNR